MRYMSISHANMPVLSAVRKSHVIVIRCNFLSGPPSSYTTVAAWSNTLAILHANSHEIEQVLPKKFASLECCFLSVFDKAFKHSTAQGVMKLTNVINLL